MVMACIIVNVYGIRKEFFLAFHILMHIETASIMSLSLDLVRYMAILIECTSH